MSAGERARASVEFDAFYAGTVTRIVRQMALLTGDLAEAEDVTSEAYERAWVNWSTVRDTSCPEAWVRTVARRLAVSRWRRLRNAATAWGRRGLASEEPALDVNHVALMTALRALPSKQRVAIVLHHLADLPVDEVAAETGASVSAVKQQLARGRAALAVLLTENEWTNEPVHQPATRKGDR